MQRMYSLVLFCVVIMVETTASAEISPKLQQAVSNEKSIPATVCAELVKPENWHENLISGAVEVSSDSAPKFQETILFAASSILVDQEKNPYKKHRAEKLAEELAGLNVHRALLNSDCAQSVFRNANFTEPLAFPNALETTLYRLSQVYLAKDVQRVVIRLEDSITVVIWCSAKALTARITEVSDEEETAFSLLRQSYQIELSKLKIAQMDIVLRSAIQTGKSVPENLRVSIDVSLKIAVCQLAQNDLEAARQTLNQILEQRLKSMSNEQMVQTIRILRYLSDAESLRQAEKLQKILQDKSLDEF